MHEREREPQQPEVQPEPVAPAPPVPRILALQRSAGNQAVTAMLARQAPPAAPPAAGTQAAAEAEALESLGLLRTVYKQMLLSAETKIRNTALMMDEPGTPPGGHRVRAIPMTIRSDSADLNLKHGTDPATSVYFFYGTKQDNEHEMGPRDMGTVHGGDTIVIRGREPGTNAARNPDHVTRTLVHETSHIIVSDYGEHPDTDKSSASFDRYKDEFRAFYVAPFQYPGIEGDARADKIREHLVGKTKGTGSYGDLDASFWAEPLDTNEFRTKVLAHKRPDGFNLNNSPYLDRLVHLLREVKAGTSTVEDALFQVSVLSPAERAEAAGSTLIPKLLAGLSGADAERVKKALNSPASVHFGKEINPNASPRVTAFLEAVTGRVPEQITETYKACNPQDRADLEANAHFLSWLGRVLGDQSVMKTCITCMCAGRSFVFYERVRVFLLACVDAAGATEMPEALRTALKGLTFEVRIAYYALCKDDYQARVQPLEPAVRNQVAAILRGDAEP